MEVVVQVLPPFIGVMNKMFKKFLLLILATINLVACEFFGSDLATYENVPVEQFVLVKKVDPNDGQTKFGAFILRSEKQSHSTYKFDWVFLKDGNSLFSIPSDSIIVGHSEFSEQIGLDFSIFSFEVSLKDDNNWWIQIPPKSMENSQPDKFCITKYKEMGDMVGEDLSLCNFVP